MLHVPCILYAFNAGSPLVICCLRRSEQGLILDQYSTELLCHAPALGLSVSHLSFQLLRTLAFLFKLSTAKKARQSDAAIDTSSVFGAAALAMDARECERVPESGAPAFQLRGRRVWPVVAR